jgi:vancomycin resistance protein YoaR
MPVRYASRGKDAAVYYSVLDLKFQNNLNIPVVIKTAEQNGKLFLALTNVPGEPPENIAKANITTTESSMETPGEIFREDQVENQTRAQIKNQVIEEAERWGVTYW